MNQKIIFVGAGPGDPDLLTIKALKTIKSAEVLLWTDSLIPEKILDFASDKAEKIRTSSLDLKTITEMMINKVKEGKKVVRLHDGDPCLFGAIAEQINLLNKSNIRSEVIPGISAFQVTA